MTRALGHRAVVAGAWVGAGVLTVLMYACALVANFTLAAAVLLAANGHGVHLGAWAAFGGGALLALAFLGARTAVRRARPTSSRVTQP